MPVGGLRAAASLVQQRSTTTTLILVECAVGHQRPANCGHYCRGWCAEFRPSGPSAESPQSDVARGMNNTSSCEVFGLVTWIVARP